MPLIQSKSQIFLEYSAWWIDRRSSDGRAFSQTLSLRPSTAHRLLGGYSSIIVEEVVASTSAALAPDSRNQTPQSLLLSGSKVSKVSKVFMCSHCRINFGCRVNNR